MIKKKCKNCNKIFKTFPYSIKKGQGLFCCMKCMFKFKLKQNIKTCIICKKKFHIKPSLYKKRKFCSKKCLIKFKLDIKNHPSWKGGKPKCIDCGKEINYRSKRCHLCENNRRKGKNSPRYGKTCYGKWGKYKGTWMRSSWEIAFAKYCIKNHIKYRYEYKTFDLGNSTYTPDFYLSKLNKYIEIKGYWRDDAKIKFKLFKRLYPKIKIILLMKNNLVKLGINLNKKEI